MTCPLAVGVSLINNVEVNTRVFGHIDELIQTGIVNHRGLHRLCCKGANLCDSLGGHINRYKVYFGTDIIDSVELTCVVKCDGVRIEFHSVHLLLNRVAVDFNQAVVSERRTLYNGVHSSISGIVCHASRAGPVCLRGDNLNGST